MHIFSTIPIKLIISSPHLGEIILKFIWKSNQCLGDAKQIMKIKINRDLPFQMLNIFKITVVKA